MWYRFECQRFTQNVSTPILSVKFPQKISPKQTRIPVVHFNSFRLVSRISLFPDLLCNIGLSVSGLRLKVVSLDLPNKSGVRMFLCFLIYCVISVWVSMVYPKYVIILDWYPYVSLFPDLLCNIGLTRTKLAALYSATKSLQNSCTAKLQLFSSLLEAKQQLYSSCSGMQKHCPAFEGCLKLLAAVLQRSYRLSNAAK